MTVGSILPRFILVKHNLRLLFLFVCLCAGGNMFLETSIHVVFLSLCHSVYFHCSPRFKSKKFYICLHFMSIFNTMTPSTCSPKATLEDVLFSSENVQSTRMDLDNFSGWLSIWPLNKILICIKNLNLFLLLVRVWFCSMSDVVQANKYIPHIS